MSGPGSNYQPPCSHVSRCILRSAHPLKVKSSLPASKATVLSGKKKKKKKKKKKRKKTNQTKKKKEKKKKKKKKNTKTKRKKNKMSEFKQTCQKWHKK